MDLRPSPIAGTWYPAEPEQLIQNLDQYLEEAEVQPLKGKPWAVVAPHAGYQFSGPVAGYSFKCLRGLDPDLVVILSPHHQFHSARLLTTAHEGYETPLGPVEVDLEAVKVLDRVLNARLGAGLTAIRNDKEHALEIELPFLQRVLGTFRLIPVMMRDQGARSGQVLGEALAETLMGEKTLLVASSDLSHFYPQDRAVQLDRMLLKRLEAFDPSGVIEHTKQGIGLACGHGAIAGVLWAAQHLGADSVRILHYATSGHVSGDLNSVVGYAAAVIYEGSE